MQVAQNLTHVIIKRLLPELLEQVLQFVPVHDPKKIDVSFSVKQKSALAAQLLIDLSGQHVRPALAALASLGFGNKTVVNEQMDVVPNRLEHKTIRRVSLDALLGEVGSKMVDPTLERHSVRQPRLHIKKVSVRR